MFHSTDLDIAGDSGRTRSRHERTGYQRLATGEFSEELYQDLQDGLVMDVLGSRIAAQKARPLSEKTAGMRHSYKTALEHLMRPEYSGTMTLGPRPDIGADAIIAPDVASSRS